MKVTASDLLAILRRFSIAADNNVPREIDQIKQSHPSPINQLVQFRFKRNFFFALFDDTAADNSRYILQQIQRIDSNTDGVLLENPTSDITTYGLPFKGKDVYLFQTVSGKKRLDILLSERHPELSRSTWQKHIKDGSVSVNGAPAKNVRQEVTDADHISITLPEIPDYSRYELPVIYMDDDVLVVNKPAGVLTHSKGALNDEFTVAEFFRRFTTVGLDTNRPGIVHRLDRDTSGVMIGARTPEAYALLKHQFAERIAKKSYIAIVKGVPKSPQATIDIPIGRNPSAPSTFRAHSNGKSAQTSYEVLDTSGGYSLVMLKPHTGRTHQLRVHLAHLGTPIVGDRLYGKPSDRMYLHAYELEITITHSERRTFTAPISRTFLTYFPEPGYDTETI
jgi:23S rRNA pseudouridine1911/1915/1917 synthase